MRMGIATSRFLAVAACALAFLAGCRDDHDDDFGPVPTDVAFFDDFSGPFPDPNWEILDGDPFTSPQEGNGAPALILQPLGDPILLVSDFVFDSTRTMTLSFDVATFEAQVSSFFRFAVVHADSLVIDASFEMFPFDDEIVLTILDTEAVLVLPPSTSFDLIEFTVDADGFATWWINGDPVVSHGGFPADLYEIDIEADGGDFTVIAVDNVLLTRP